jgi:hypothetical protein
MEQIGFKFPTSLKTGIDLSYSRTPLQIKNHFSKLLKEIMNMMINPLRQNKKR